MYDHGLTYRSGIANDLYALSPEETNDDWVSVDVIITFDGFTQSPNIGTRVDGDPIELIGRDTKAVPPRRRETA